MRDERAEAVATEAVAYMLGVSKLHEGRFLTIPCGSVNEAKRMARRIRMKIGALQGRVELRLAKRYPEVEVER